MNEQNKNEKKQVILSGIQPTGVFTLGNYLGAVRNWVNLQKDYDCEYMIADLHAITIRQDSAQLRQQTLSSFALILACGVDPEKSLAFIQSHVPTHAELAWVLSCYTQFGELARMTQFKDKSAKHQTNINAGLFTYPSLMAADILLYNADLVPVGADQKQHIEITRDIAERFNSIYSPTFKIPEPYIPKVGAKIMSLSDPSKKMSKSDDNINATISILDKPDDIIKKFKKAVTDSENVIKYDESKAGINNLMTIYSVITNKNFDEIEKEFQNCGYGIFKLAVGETVSDYLKPIRENYERLLSDKAYLEECYTSGAKKAYYLSSKILEKVYRKVGFIKQPKLF